MKKYITIMMAAASAVTVLAPVGASAEVLKSDVDKSEVVAKVKKALAEKYVDKWADGINVSNASTVSEDYLNSRYIVLLDKTNATTSQFSSFEKSAYGKMSNLFIDLGDGKSITNKNDKYYLVDDAEKLSRVLEGKSDVRVLIIDKGIKNGKSTEILKKKHLVVGAVKDADKEVSLNDLAKELFDTTDTSGKPTFVKDLSVVGLLDGKRVTLVGNKVAKNASPDLSNDMSEVKLTLTSGAEFTFIINDLSVDIKKGIDSNNGSVDLGKIVGTEPNAQSTFDSVVKFQNIENVGGDATVDIRFGDTREYTIQDVSDKNIKLSSIYTREGGYTKEGANFVNSLIKANDDPYKFNYGGINYFVKPATDPNADRVISQLEKAKIQRIGGKYVLNLDLKVEDANDRDRSYTLRFSLDSKNQKDLADVLRDLTNKDKTEVVAGHYQRLIGSDRYATSIEVSSSQFDVGSASSVVIVGAHAPLDGLAASPLASAKNAPILLASPKSGLSAATIDEISRATDNKLKNKNVYIVGGKASVPESVEKQLSDKFGAVVVRLAGDDRQKTSLEVAQRLYYDGNVNTKDGNDAFIVGANGAADAMTIAGVAATPTNVTTAGAPEKLWVRPIVVASIDGIKQSTRVFFLDKLKASKLTLIGGENTISTQVLKDAQVSVVTGGKAERIAGSDRYDTNIAILNKFYKGDKTTTPVVKPQIDPNGAIFVSGKDKLLVDAQTSGAFSANKRLPIVLTSDKLTKDQSNLMKKDGVLENKKKNIYQVGGVVSTEVMKEVVSLLGL